MGDPIEDYLAGRGTKPPVSGGGPLELDPGGFPNPYTDPAQGGTLPIGGQAAGTRVAPSADGGTSSTSSSRRHSTEQSTTTRLNRTWVNVPTPEQFLDDFKNGIATYLKNVKASGGIGVNEIMWLMDNTDILFNEYLGTLGNMATRGEAVFRPVNLGTYPGDESTTISSGRTVGTDQQTTSRQRVGTEPLPPQPSGTQPGGSAGGGTEPPAGGAVVAGGSPLPSDRVSTSAGTSESTSEGTSTSIGTEVIGARPAPGYVHTLAPLDFLSKQFPASSLKILFEGRRGMRRANERVGGGTISPRRAG